ncbi:hypothetical protein ABEB36_011803 [Hypothenemus hampei]|uniref:Endoplasmic reticulum lectin 1 n=1 Tax=Hypothenemus hampei TaxID=57062 RepID=A0ABD1E930_HYPHA
MSALFIFLSVLSFFSLAQQLDIKGFDDSIVFDIDFLGTLDGLDLDRTESMVITSAHKEKYKCNLPNIAEKDEVSSIPYSGPSPLALISPLFSQGICSYRLESYWTYDVCHGKYIRQYHEEREGKKVKLQEYILGKWDEKHLERLMEKFDADRIDLKDDFVPETKKIDNINLPYFEIQMGNGTACDLNYNKPRTTKVIYVCYIHGKHEVYLLKETSTCSYEIIILTPLLCAHPKYKPKDSGALTISCAPLAFAHKEPYSLRKLKAESLKLRRNAELDRIKVELVQFKAEDAITGDSKSPKFITDKVMDTSPVRSFLQGKHCLYGGSGWWKFEFCYGKSVEQFHIERDSSRTSINLGIFSKDKHLEWIKEHPHKRPKPLENRKQLSHFYSEGSICDKTGKPRQTEVKLKCPEKSGSPTTSVSLYLLEPKYCEYILGVESPLICEILDRADENGLVEVPADFGDEETVEDEGDFSSFTIKL